MENEKIAVKVSLITIIGNIMFFLIKIVAGICGHSDAMISDAVHTLSDILSTFVVIADVKIANKEPDTEHPYGQERMEDVASLSGTHADSDGTRYRNSCDQHYMECEYVTFGDTYATYFRSCYLIHFR